MLPLVVTYLTYYALIDLHEVFGPMTMEWMTSSSASRPCPKNVVSVSVGKDADEDEVADEDIQMTMPTGTV